MAPGSRVRRNRLGQAVKYHSIRELPAHFLVVTLADFSRLTRDPRRVGGPRGISVARNRFGYMISRKIGPLLGQSGLYSLSERLSPKILRARSQVGRRRGRRSRSSRCFDRRLVGRGLRFARRHHPRRPRPPDSTSGLQIGREVRACGLSRPDRTGGCLPRVQKKGLEIVQCASITLRQLRSDLVARDQQIL